MYPYTPVILPAETWQNYPLFRSTSNIIYPRSGSCVMNVNPIKVYDTEFCDSVSKSSSKSQWFVSSYMHKIIQIESAFSNLSKMIVAMLALLSLMTWFPVLPPTPTSQLNRFDDRTDLSIPQKIGLPILDKCQYEGLNAWHYIVWFVVLVGHTL